MSTQVMSRTRSDPEQKLKTVISRGNIKTETVEEILEKNQSYKKQITILEKRVAHLEEQIRDRDQNKSMLRACTSYC